MSHNIVNIQWTPWLKEGSAEWQLKKVLYIYATDDEILYVGEARGAAVGQRYDSHKDDGVIRRTGRRAHGRRWDVKVGVFKDGWVQRKNRKDLFALIHIVQTLFIYVEHWTRGFCKANNASLWTRKECRSGMEVVNHGRRFPLGKAYYDIGMALR